MARILMQRLVSTARNTSSVMLKNSRRGGSEASQRLASPPSSSLQARSQHAAAATGAEKHCLIKSAAHRSTGLTSLSRTTTGISLQSSLCARSVPSYCLPTNAQAYATSVTPKQTSSTPDTSGATSLSSAKEEDGEPLTSGSEEEGASRSRTAQSGFPLGKFFLLSAGVAAIGVGIAYMLKPDATKTMLTEGKDQLDKSIKYFTEPSKEKFLPEPMPMYPGGPPMKTLVLDLDDTLIHSTWSRQSGWKIAKRPGLEAFLAYMSSFYEIVVFTSGLNSYADPILDRLDPNGYIMHRLYRDATKYENGQHVYDLSKLNRDLSNVILLDSHADHAKDQPDNLLLVKAWKNDPKDRSLLELIPFLESVVRDDIKDIRPVLSSYGGVDIPSEYQARRRRQEEVAAAHASAWGGGLGMGASARDEKLEPPPGSIWAHLRQK
mmetsp:Transcript_6932/g.12489  ORF Transcript_6932/g.12489 Transcript_6932/m.12489 type:complete len:435 (+) Transcript_6932:143-1447(+)